MSLRDLAIRKAPAHVHEPFRGITVAPPRINHILTSATRRNSRATRNANCPCGSQAISWISAAQGLLRLLGTARQGDSRERERTAWGRVEWSSVIRYLKSGHRRGLQGSQAISPCACARGSRTNQAAPKATLLRHPPSRPTGDENRTQPWTKTQSTHGPASLRHNVTRVV